MLYRPADWPEGVQLMKKHIRKGLNAFHRGLMKVLNVLTGG